MVFTTKLQRLRNKIWWMSTGHKAVRAVNQDYLQPWGDRESEGEMWPWKQKPAAISYLRGWNRSLLSGFLKIKSATSKGFFQVHILFYFNLDGNSFLSNWSLIRRYSMLRLLTSLWSWGTMILSHYQTNLDSELCILKRFWIGYKFPFTSV